jgi:pimeloyl-ACP methyl ester carboxylesterase
MGIHLKTSGTGRPLVLLHAYPLSSDMWAGLKPSAGWEWILPDFPGFGTTPPGGLEMTLRGVAKELVEELENRMGLKPFVLGGISMGGYLAFEILRQYPERVQGLVLISTRAGADAPEARQKRLGTAERALREGVSWLPGAMLPGLLGDSTRQNKQEVVEKVRAMIARASAEGVAAAQRAMAARRDQADLCPGIRQKTLIMAGLEDALIPISESEGMAQMIPGAKKVFWEKVGHLPPLEAPALFSDELERFLSDLS